ncbi:hypothetical protein OG900_14690 [Streptomyces sp. NBC_00433]
MRAARTAVAQATTPVRNFPRGNDHGQAHRDHSRRPRGRRSADRRLRRRGRRRRPRQRDKPAASSTAGKTPAAAPIVTPAQPAAVLDNYEKVNTAADKTQDKALLGTIEGGALYQEDSEVYKQYPKLSAKDRKSCFEPFTYSRRQFFIPATGSWFTASGCTGDTLQLLVFQQQTGGHWKMVVANNHKGTLPALAAGQGGAPVVVAPDATVGATKLSALGAAISDLRASGGTKAGAALADPPARRAAVTAYRTRQDHWGRYKTCLRPPRASPCSSAGDTFPIGASS